MRATVWYTGGVESHLTGGIMNRIAVAVAMLCSLLGSSLALADEPPSPRDMAESMRACEAVSEVVDTADPGGVVVHHPEPLEDFVITSGVGEPNAEHYRHWWNPEVMLVFPRYAPGWETPAPWPVLREWRNRTIQCFYMVPPVPSDYSR
jgi:hypothetical protein